jgi:anti-sigma B factor antagonist
MAKPDFQQIRVEDVGGVAVVEFISDRLMFETEVVEAIGRELNTVFSNERYTKILLDFSNVQYISSTMLGKLAALEQNARIAKRRLKLCGLGPILQDTFRIGHFDRVFSVYDDVESALKSEW